MPMAPTGRAGQLRPKPNSRVIGQTCVMSALSLSVGFTMGLIARCTLSRQDDPIPKETVASPELTTSQQTQPLQFTGVAVTIIGDRLRSPSSVLAQLSMVEANLPASWRGIDAYVRDIIGVGKQFGVRPLKRVNRLTLIQLEQNLRHLSQRSILLSPQFWSQIREKRLLFFEVGTTVMCSNAHLSIDDEALRYYDWVGAPWKWAKAGSPHAHGGNGAFSLRNRDMLLEMLRRNAVPDKGNEDMWYVSKLASSPRLPLPIGRKPRLAPRNVSSLFAVEEIYMRGSEAPVGVYHLMRTLPYANRSRLLRDCPEAKLLFTAKHDPRCSIRCPRNRSLLDRPLSVWKKLCSAEPAQGLFTRLAGSGACDLVEPPPSLP